MKLSEYLERQSPKVSHAVLAERIGISRSFLTEILSGQKRPGFDTMIKIENATRGAVPIQAWREDAA